MAPCGIYWHRSLQFSDLYNIKLKTLRILEKRTSVSCSLNMEAVGDESEVRVDESEGLGKVLLHIVSGIEDELQPSIGYRLRGLEIGVGYRWWERDQLTFTYPWRPLLLMLYLRGLPI